MIQEKQAKSYQPASCYLKRMNRLEVLREKYTDTFAQFSSYTAPNGLVLSRLAI